MQPSESNNIVHLVAAPSATPSAPAQGRVIPTVLCAQAIQHNLTPPGKIILIGDQTSSDQANKLGLIAHARIAPPMGKTILARRQLKQHITKANRIICWNDELIPLLKGIPAELDLISTLPQAAPNYVSKRINIRTFEPQDFEYWTNRGLHPTNDTLLPKVLDNLCDDQTQHTRKQIRATMGIDQSTMCIGVIADRPSDVDARELAFLLGLLNASGYCLSGVVPSTASHLAAARRHHRGLGSPFQLLIATDPITSMLPAFDTLIHPRFDGSGSSMLIERMCENAEVPVLRLKQSTRAGLSRAPGVAGPIIEQLDEMIEANQSKQEPAHA